MVGLCEAISGSSFSFLSFFFFSFAREKVPKRLLVEEIEIAFGLEAASDRESKERKVAFSSPLLRSTDYSRSDNIFSSLGNFSSCRETREKVCIDVITLRYVKLRYP